MRMIRQRGNREENYHWEIGNDEEESQQRERGNI
jgi:hypothetical protein